MANASEAGRRYGERPITRDWFEAAGWRRLRLLNRSLGELSHFTPDSRWSGARAALTLALPEYEEGTPEKVARGGALRAAIALLGAETIAWLRQLSPSLAAGVGEILTSDQRVDQVHEEKWLTQVWSGRGESFGEPDATRLPFDD